MKAPFFFGWRNTPATSRWLRVADAASCARLHRTSFAHPWSVPEFEALLNDPACVADGVGFERGVADAGGDVVAGLDVDDFEAAGVGLDQDGSHGGLSRWMRGRQAVRLLPIPVI